MRTLIYFKTNYKLFIVYIVYAFLAGLIVNYEGYKAQDFGTHFGYVEKILSGIPVFSVDYGTNPPALFYLTSIYIKIFGLVSGLNYLIISFIIINCISLHIFWLCISKLLPEREAYYCLLFSATLPSFVATSVVYAGDALVFIPFFLFCYCCLLILEDDKKLNIKIVIIICLIEMISGLIKYTLIILPVAMIFINYIFYKKYHLTYFIRLSVIIITVLVPLSSDLYFMNKFHGASSHEIKFPNLTGKISLRSLLGVYEKDWELFEAPLYFEPIMSDGKQIMVDHNGREVNNGRPGYKILVDNKYSYSGLLNLSIHTDIMNITHRRNVSRNGFSEYDAVNVINNFFQKLSVYIGAILSFILLISIIYYIYYNAYKLLKIWSNKQIYYNKDILFMIALVVPAILFYFLIVGLLPFVNSEVYYFGYWLPRLIMPSLLIFSSLMFWVLYKIKNFSYFFNLLYRLIIIKIFAQIFLQIF